MNIHRSSALLVVCCLLLSACTVLGDDGGGPEVPAGWTTTTGEGFEVSHPADWTVERAEVGGHLDLVGPEGPLDARVLISAAPQRTAEVAAEDLLQALVGELEFTPNDISDLVRDSEIEPWSPTNATDGAQQRISYDQQVDGDPLRIAEVIGVALGAGVEVQVRAVDRADRFDDVEPQLREIMSTLVLTGA